MDAPYNQHIKSTHRIYGLNEVERIDAIIIKTLSKKYKTKINILNIHIRLIKIVILMKIQTLMVIGINFIN